MKKRTRVCYILSYKDPGYVRSQYIIQTLDLINKFKVFTAINKQTNALRYIEVLLKTIWLRISSNPDVYILGFRGVEHYWAIRIITLGKPLVYDEFVNPYMWAIEEHKKFNSTSFRAAMLRAYLRSIYWSADLILCDTNINLDYSSTNFNVHKSKFAPLYVGTNEQVFKPIKELVGSKPTKTFDVFFYGSFLPLHGIDHIVAAAGMVQEHKDITFTIVGGAKRKNDMKRFKDFISKNSIRNIKHIDWLDFGELPAHIAKSDLSLGGPFGNTVQSKSVITGKTYQFLSMGAPTIVGVNDEGAGFVDKKNCLIVEQGSSEGLASKIVWAYKNQDKLQEIGNAGKQLYEEKFSVRAQSKKLESYISSLL
jgi:glycosyltransferase involved in cell wall biosynthesis